MDDSNLGRILKWGLGATGLSAVAAAFVFPHPYGLLVAGAILLLFLLLFGGYYLWQRRRARSQSKQFASALEAQTAAAPKSISDPNQRASLDSVRQKFQTGLQQFKSRGKDIYKLPWYVIIGESGSGKTEAIRHSGIEFPSGLQDQLQGSGGTVNMDWWFTNRGIILDTAGSMLFNEARAGESPEWREFLKLLKRARPHCPINGLFLVLSVESLIKDSADKIAQKASRLAQQLDLIQRTLDVRFPVYLLVTKCDLLIGFREFFDNIEDPLLQHQMFGWSNPEPLDAHFRPDLIEQNLGSVAGRLRRRRLALIREVVGSSGRGDTEKFFATTTRSTTTGPTRKLDEVDGLFALPESVMRLAPRLRRYLETVFVAGEWSAKPVFLRGIYFTSSMREGKALDEAIALATGLSLDQLPEERNWEKNRAFFLCDLFKEKVFRESGLVTRATNTLKLLRQRQLAIFGTAGLALLLLLVFAGFAYRGLRRSVLAEKTYWQVGAGNWTNGLWSPALVSDTPVEGFRFAYGGTNPVPGLGNLSLLDYQRRLRQVAEKPLAISWIFKPMAWMNAGSVKDRAAAQRVIFEGSILKPLVLNTRAKMRQAVPSAASLARHREALISLMELEADGLTARENGGALADPAATSRYLHSFLSYLTDEDARLDTNLVNVFAWTYSKEALRQSDGVWPPKNLLGGSSLASNPAIDAGLKNFQTASRREQSSIDQQLKLVDTLADKLNAYYSQELAWLTNATADSCTALSQNVAGPKAEVDAAWKALEAATNFAAGPVTSLAARYGAMATAATNASASVFSAPIGKILIRLSRLPPEQSSGLFNEIKSSVDALAGQAAEPVLKSYNDRRMFLSTLDANCVAPSTNSSEASCQVRWMLYTNACDIVAHPTVAEDSDIGNEWKRFTSLQDKANRFQTNVSLYAGPLAPTVSAACSRIAGDAVQRLQQQFVQTYVVQAAKKLSDLKATSPWTVAAISDAGQWLGRIGRDLEAGGRLGDQQTRLDPVRKALDAGRESMLKSMDSDLSGSLGFPAALNAAQVGTAGQIAALRQILDELLKALQDPVWQADKSGALDALRANCSRTADVVRSLVKPDGTPAEFALYFVPPTDASSPNDKAIPTVFRVADLSSGRIKATIADLSKARSDDESSCSFGKLSMDGGLRLVFHHLSDADPKKDPEVVGVNYENWALIRLIQSGKAERGEDGAKWTFRVPLPLREGTTGDLIFEARLDPKLPLPKPDNWPKIK